MGIYSISDLHLSFSTNKPMDIFGEQWQNHPEKIKQNWLSRVSPTDTVLIPGDISWAMTMDEIGEDLKFIESLPGIKVMIRGNHDYWWSSIGKVRKELPAGIYAIQNDSFDVGSISICGTRGWVCPGGRDFTDHDQTIYEREAHRLELSLITSKQDRKWVMLHYPPTNEQHQQSLFTDLMKKYQVERCVYGHLHGNSHQNALNGVHFNIHFSLVACDYLNFVPLLLE